MSLNTMNDPYEGETNLGEQNEHLLAFLQNDRQTGSLERPEGFFPHHHFENGKNGKNGKNGHSKQREETSNLTAHLMGFNRQHGSLERPEGFFPHHHFENGKNGEVQQTSTETRAELNRVTDEMNTDAEKKEYPCVPGF